MPPALAKATVPAATRGNIGFRLAKASQRWNELLADQFVAAGYPEVRPAYGSILLPLWEEDDLRMGELGARARLAKQTMTTMVRLMERDGLVSRAPDPDDGRAQRVRLTDRGDELRKVATKVLGALDRRLRERLTEREIATFESCLLEVMSL